MARLELILQADTSLAQRFINAIAPFVRSGVVSPDAAAAWASKLITFRTAPNNQRR